MVQDQPIAMRPIPRPARAGQSGRPGAAGRRMLAAVLLGCLALAGCVAPTTGGRATSNAVAVADGRVTLVAPRGYCVDRSSLRERNGTSFAIFGGCAAISGDPSQPAAPFRAILGATVGPDMGQVLVDPDAATLGRIEAFFRSAAGRAALARSGQAGDVEIVGASRSNGVLFLHVVDRSAASKVPVAPEYWRAVTGVEGRLSVFSVMPLADNTLSDARQQALLRDFIQATQAASRPKTTPTTAP